TASSLLASVMINSLILYKNTIIYKESAQRYRKLGAGRSATARSSLPALMRVTLREVCVLPSKRKTLLQRKKKSCLSREKLLKSLEIL
ncbi:hypothetical protein, partial [Porphyromonas sp.]|uniref:hypothetical protein n=1 Tax=Porphyromonas sp. TaxID=1924944 RepID=UPI0025809334